MSEGARRRKNRRKAKMQAYCIMFAMVAVGFVSGFMTAKNMLPQETTIQIETIEISLDEEGE